MKCLCFLLHNLSCDHILSYSVRCLPRYELYIFDIFCTCLFVKYRKESAPRNNKKKTFKINHSLNIDRPAIKLVLSKDTETQITHSTIFVFNLAHMVVVTTTHSALAENSMIRNFADEAAFCRS